ncbi:Lysosomal protective protein precursor, putative [Perkinsus marinus ATCC 50983]|uniref:Carboxypeptidase n=1 Tax=Perkinsus marinus (strain ATCC 50983 / TXsc) TaxID=423536 RepID=C5LVN0_PERM5|nr:Lysosomal protective protein precursor, putative [Perkinsus marinus ATCC 50983]EEQ99153.1 Lysosomal protective protein precursor, putative [Perkinsus marinus ATCC 50983]|eukprot:XP_002766436.1 Lysosomal protective protein precursor, putative [Perkinsus marinus ATCC 50983]
MANLDADFPSLSQSLLLGRSGHAYTVLSENPTSRNGNKCEQSIKKKATVAAVVLAVLTSFYLYYVNAYRDRPQSLQLNSSAAFLLNNDFSSVGFEHQEYLAGAGRKSHLLLREPRLCDANVKQYSGYFTIDDKLDKKYFFWFFEKRNQQPTEAAPTTMWLTGGPGSSSMIALLAENGPCRVNEDGSNTVHNEYSWTQKTNMLWVDQPPGTGFSTGSYDTSEVEIAEDMYHFLQAFFHRFPQYNKKFHITGESYGGHYVPVVTAKIIDENKRLLSSPSSSLLGSHRRPVYIDIKGMAVGNGLTVPAEQVKWYSKMAYNSGTAPSIVNYITYQQLNDAGLETVDLIDKCYKHLDVNNANSPLPTACQEMNYVFNVKLLSKALASGANEYDMRLNHPYNFSHLDRFLNRPDVRAELGAVIKPWSESNTGVWTALAPRDFLADYTSAVQTVLASGAKVLIYAGDQDFICNWLGNKAWTEKIEWKFSRDFAQQPLLEMNAQKAVPEASGNGEDAEIVKVPVGLYKGFKNFAFLRVFGAGHMAPMDKPLETLHMYETFIDGHLFQSYED